MGGMPMSQIHGYLVIAAIGTAIFLSGCDNENGGGSTTDQDAIATLVEGDQDMFGVSLLADEDDYGVGGGSGMHPAETIEPVAFWRHGVRSLQSVDVQVFGDSAVATVTHHFDGQFRIAVLDSSNPPFDYHIYSKDMYNSITRKAIFERMGMGYPNRGWRMSAVSMAEGVSRDPNPHTVTISRFRMVRVTGGGQETVVLDTQNPLETIVDRESLITFSRGDSAKVFVTLSNADSALGLLHYRLHRLWAHHRRPLHDDGIYPDEVAGDGIYSGIFDVGLLPGVYHSCVDMIDHDTVYDDSAPYDADVWGIPYRVTF